MRPAASPLAVETPPDASSAPPPLPRRRWRWAVAAALVALALVAGLLWWRLDDGGPAPLTAGDVTTTVQQQLAKAQQQQRAAPQDATAAYQLVRPSLVSIQTDLATKAANGSAEVGSGAGVVINADGSVLTALHVVQGGKSIQVRFADGTVARATIARSEPASDIAVLSVDRLPTVVVPAVLGGGTEVGDAVYAVGDPLGLTESMSAGVVSALDRSIKVPGGRTLSGLIQIDAAVNPGNSGGPLLDRDGDVIGIVTALANPADKAFFVGIGFAVPIATAGGVGGAPPR